MAIVEAQLDRQFVEEFESRKYSSVYDMHTPGRIGTSIPELTVPRASLPPSDMLRDEDELILPEVGELEAIRYFSYRSRQNYSIETDMDPLGSCTMKYNPKINDEVANMPGFAWTHPDQPVETIQGNLRMIHELQGMLKEITGMDAVDVTPMAGAHGELAGILTIKAYHQDNKKEDDPERTKVLVPDSAHGTNPATAAMAGFEVITIKSNSDGDVDQDDLDAKIAEFGPQIAAMMLTYPSTLGLPDKNILHIAKKLHDAGALLYGDGANMNALVGRVRLGDLGFDVMHLNLHKTFSTPHGGGGPGAGPIAVKAHLAEFLPGPIVDTDKEGKYTFITPAKSFGRMGGHFGNFGVYIRAYTYMRSLGSDGLRAISGNAVLNANYLGALVEDIFARPFGKGRHWMHEVVVSGLGVLRLKGITTNIVKRLIDYGFHPPTIYFPLVIEEALMIEPTESETKGVLDRFAAALRVIAREAKENIQLLKDAPHATPVGRLDEAIAARKPVLTWKPPETA